MTKTRDKKRILKGKKKRTKPKTKYKGNPIRLSAHFSTETLQAGGINMIYLKWWKGKTYNQEYFTQQGSCSDLMGRSKALQRNKSSKSSAPPSQFIANVIGTSLGEKETRKLQNEKAHW